MAKKKYTIEDIRNIGNAGGKTVRWIKDQGLKLTDFTEDEVNEIILTFLQTGNPPSPKKYKIDNYLKSGRLCRDN